MRKIILASIPIATAIIAYLLWKNSPAGFKRKITGTLESIIDNASYIYKVPKALIVSVVKTESAGNPNAVSPVGAIGLMQIMPTTGASECNLSKTDLFVPDKNVSCGSKFLAGLISKYGRIDDALAHYYGGGKAVDYRKTYGKYRDDINKYVSKVMGDFIKFREYYG